MILSVHAFAGATASMLWSRLDKVPSTRKRAGDDDWLVNSPTTKTSVSDSMIRIVAFKSSRDSILPALSRTGTALCIVPRAGDEYYTWLTRLAFITAPSLPGTNTRASLRFADRTRGGAGPHALPPRRGPRVIVTVQQLDVHQGWRSCPSWNSKGKGEWQAAQRTKGSVSVISQKSPRSEDFLTV